MGDDSIHLADLLLKFQEAITDTIRYEVGQARADFKEGLHEVALQQATDRADVSALKTRVELIDQRTKLTSRGLLSALTRKQKAALYAGVGGFLLDALSRLWAFVSVFINTRVHP